MTAAPGRPNLGLFNLSFNFSQSRQQLYQQRRRTIMAACTSTNSGLYAGLPPLPHVEGAEPQRIAMDAFKLAIADQVSKILDISPAKVFEAVQTSAKGCDCNIAVPRFKLGGDAKALAKRVAEEVRRLAKPGSQSD